MILVLVQGSRRHDEEQTLRRGGFRLPRALTTLHGRIGRHGVPLSNGGANVENVESGGLSRGFGEPGAKTAPAMTHFTPLVLTQTGQNAGVVGSLIVVTRE